MAWREERGSQVGMKVCLCASPTRGRIHGTFQERPQLTQESHKNPAQCVCCRVGDECNRTVVCTAPFGVNIMGEGNDMWKLMAMRRKGGKMLIKTKSVNLDINTPLFSDAMAAAAQSAMWYIIQMSAEEPPTTTFTSPSVLPPEDHICSRSLWFGLQLSPPHTLWGLISPPLPDPTYQPNTQSLIIEHCVWFVSAGRSHEITFQCIKGYSIKLHLNHQENKTYCYKPELFKKVSDPSKKKKKMIGLDIPE